jgi:ABC-type transport system involved in cytochrome bd biosynthesis fused ATPase/permease subunit
MENLVLGFLTSTKALRCVILVTHRVKIARLCDTIYVLENGRIQASGTPAQLMKSDNLYSLSMADQIY